jgi:hypothetical protein
MYAFEASIACPSYALTDCNTISKSYTIRLGGARRYYRKCDYLPYLCGNMNLTIAISQVVFLIDVPRTSGSKIASDNTLTPFARELIHFLKAMGLDSTIVESLRKFDFSNTNHLRLVHSMYAVSLQHVTLAVIGLIQNSGGSHFDADMHRTGYSGLGNAVRDLGLDTEELPEVDIIVCFTFTDNC